MNESNIFGVSVRGWLAIIIVCCCCALSIWLKDMGVLKDLALMAVSFYFGTKQQTQGGTNVSTSQPSNISVTAAPTSDG